MPCTHTHAHTKMHTSIDIPEPVTKVICLVDLRLESVGICCKRQRPQPSEEKKTASLARKN